MTLNFIISFHFDFNERGWKIKEKQNFSLYFARFALSLQPFSRRCYFTGPVA